MGWTFYNSSGQQLKNTGSTALTQLDIDGATDIGAAIVDADLFIVDDGAGGTNRKTAASRLKTYIAADQITTKTAADAQAISSSTTFTDHNGGAVDYTFTAAASTYYMVTFMLRFGGINDGGGAKMQLTVPTNGSYHFHMQGGIASNAGTSHSNQDTGTGAITLVTGASGVAINAYFVTFRVYGGDGGAVTMQWAQQASSGNAVTLTADTWMTWEPTGD